MIIAQMSKLGVTSDMMSVLGFASIAGSIGIWRVSSNSGDAAHGERFGIFVGLWAPTFFTLAGQLATLETEKRAESAASIAG